MRAIAEPKYATHIVAKPNYVPNHSDGGTLSNGIVSVLKTVDLGMGVAATFYVDYLNSGIWDKEVQLKC